MIIEFGNHEPLARRIDSSPCVTRLHIPEADDQGLGGYTYKAGGLTPQQFKEHLSDAIMFNNGTTRLPEHEIALASHMAWASQGGGRPKWLQVYSHEETHGKGELESAHSKKTARHLENFLHEHFSTDGTRKPEDVELRYHTRFGPPGVGGPAPQPEPQNVFTYAGQAMSNNNDGGGQSGLTGTGTSATATSLTNSGAAWATNQWANYRVYCMQTATGPLVWANVLSNTGTVLTLDRWYNAATPGGAAATTPSAGFYYVLADGGATSSWFVGLANANNTLNRTDTALANEYTTGGMVRKISPFAETHGVANRSFTLTPVYTANGSEGTQTFYSIGAFASLVVGSGLMKFQSTLNAPATIAVNLDQVTVTETGQGS